MAGPPVTPDPRTAFLVARRGFAVALGLIFFSAFVSLGVQVRGLFGSRGIAPIADFLEAVGAQLGGGAWMQVPSIFWLHAGDGFFVGICAAGAVLSLLLAAGVAPGACALGCWGLYLSFCAVGSPFLNFQWDALLLETAFLASIYLPWSPRPVWSREGFVSRVARWLLWWLLFRLMFESGVVKLTSGDPTWRDLSALEFHFETQPLPLWTAWFVHQLPAWILRAATAVMFAIEFVAPLLIVAPRRWRQAGATALLLLQLGIALTGNYAFFNCLTAALCLLLFDDAAWRNLGAAIARCLRRPPAAEPLSVGSGAPLRRWPLFLFAPLAVVIVVVTTMPLVGSFRTGWKWPEPLAGLQRALAPSMSFNGYGLFAVMTTTRPEILVEGSMDGVNWQTYGFRWKPGDPRNRPRLVAPHQPRLDWQMWFAALGDVRQNPWFVNFLARLLQGSPDVTALLERNPFPRQPPRYVRAVLYEYRFTTWGERPWWKREEKGLYCPPISLRAAAGDVP